MRVRFFCYDEDRVKPSKSAMYRTESLERRFLGDETKKTNKGWKGCEIVIVLFFYIREPNFVLNSPFIN